MTDADETTMVLRVPSDLSDAPGPEAAQSVGQQLKRARMNAGLSLESVSARLKVSVPRLQGFENDQFEQGPNLHISRAMVASVARFLGLDAQAMLAQLPQPKPQPLISEMQQTIGGIHKDTRLSMPRDAHSPISPVWWVALVLLVLAAVVYLYPGIAPLVHPSPAAAIADLISAPAPSLGASQPASEVPSERGASAPVPTDSLPPALAQSGAANASVSGVKVVQPVLVFRARGSTWIEVTDAKGTVLLRRTLATAEAVEVGGDLPLSVVIGRADHTEVLVRGTVFPLDTHTQDNVARFKVP